MTSLRFEDLPSEIRELIFSYLDTKSLLSACRVNRTWYGWIIANSEIWRKPCLSVGLKVKDEKDEVFGRALFVNLSGRKRSLQDGCFASSSYIDRGIQITALYYYGGRLATSFRDGVIELWGCIAHELTVYGNACLWANFQYSCCVTSIKFDDHLIMAAYADGTITAWNISTGYFRNYINPCVCAVTIDYMAEANLVVSAHDAVVVWNMSTGQLVEKKDLRHNPPALKVVIGPYPGEGCMEEGRTIRRSLIACMNMNYVFVWVATYNGENQSDMNFVMEFLREIWIACGNSICVFPRGSYITDSLFLDGRYLCFTKHARRTCHGKVCHYDVISDFTVIEDRLSYRIKLLLGVGKKYMLMIISVSNWWSDQLVVMDRESRKLIIRIGLESQIKLTPGPLIPPCIGEKSWLDGFDGQNDRGVVCAQAFHPSWVKVTTWSPRMGFWR